MDEVIAKFTEASALQYFAAFVSLVWLVGLVGLPRGKRRSAGARDDEGSKSGKEKT